MKTKKSSSISGNIKRIARIDPVLTVSVILLNLMGLISIRSITGISGSSSILIKQAAGSVIGIIIMIALSVADTGRITKYWKIFYIITVISLLAVLIFGSSGGGARRWITIAGLTYQPSELAKILLILFYSKYIIEMEGKLSRPLVYVFSTLLILPPFFMILKEPDLSTGIMIFLIFCVILFVAGIDRKIVAGVTAAAIPTAFIIVYLSLIGDMPFLGDYQHQRILAWLRRIRQ